MGAPTEKAVGIEPFVGVREFPNPPAEEIMVMVGEEIEVGVEIKGQGRIALPLIRREIAPRMRSGQIDRFPATVGKITGIGSQHPQGTRGRRRKSGTKKNANNPVQKQ